MTDLNDVADHLLQADQPVQSASDVADALGCSRRHALDLLRLLERDGTVRSRQVGASAVAWWHSERTTPPQVPPQEHTDQSNLSAAPSPDARETAENRSQIDTAIQSVEIPGSGRRLDQRQEALREAIKYIQEQGEATAGEIREHVHQEEPAGYDKPRSAWKNFLQPALGELDEQERHVTLLDPHSGTWAARE